MEGGADFEEEIRIAVLDVETTGLSVTEDRIIQIAILIVNHEAKPLQLYDSYINPGQTSELVKSYHIHQITPDLLRDAPTFEAKADEILGVLSNVDVVAGHNVVFDFEFLRNEFGRVLHLDTVKDESESDETWQTIKNSHTADCKSSTVKYFDSLKFKLLDSFRLALIALPNQQSYSLSALSKHLGIQAKRFQATGYKWGSKNVYSENVFDASETVENMREHNAITDVLQTEQLLKRCLSTLNIRYTDIINGKFQRFEIDKQLLLAANKLMEKKTPTSDELIELVKLAPDQINIHFPERSKCFIDLSIKDIKEVINFLSTRQHHSDKRQKLICQGYLQLVLDKEKFDDVCKEISKQRRNGLQSFDNREVSKRVEVIKESVPCKAHDVKEANKQESDITDIKKKSLSTDEVLILKSKSQNRGDGDVPCKVAGYAEEEEGNAIGTIGSKISSYEEETEEYEILQGCKADLLNEDYYDSCESLSKGCIVGLERSKQESMPMPDSGSSWSESIITQNGCVHGSQEYLMKKRKEITPEKDNKQEEEMKKMRMFSPTF